MNHVILRIQWVITIVSLCACVGLSAGEDVLGDKVIDLNKPVRLFALGGVPGYISTDGTMFTSVHGYRKVIESSTNAVVITVPFWLSRKPSQVVMDKLTPAQLAFWEKINTESSVCGPLLNKQAGLQSAYDAAVESDKNLREAINREVRKANENNDKAALSSTAQKSRQARLARAQASITQTRDALAEWKTTPDYVMMQDSERRLAALWVVQVPALKPPPPPKPVAPK